MNNRKIVIDPGHGGEDSGATGNGIIEKDYNLKISDYIYNRLKELGLDVKMTRTTDETLSPTERVNRVLNAFGNSRDVIVLSNHINAGGGDGAEVIYALRNKSTLANLILNELQKEGQNVREAYQRRLPANTAKDYYFIHRDTGVTEPVIVEYGFLDSTKDDVNQLKNNYEDYAEAVVRAVSNYLGYNYIPLEGEVYYTVKSGDSLWSIAKKYGISADALKKYNNIGSNLLSIGQLIKIPPKQTNEQVQVEKTYIVKSGDSLYKIASNYNTTVSELINYNDLNNNLLSIGQIIKIPSEKSNEQVVGEKTYVVKSGDSLYKIASNYNTTVSELMNYNNLSSNLLSIGQIIKIPESQSVSGGKSYSVKQGDTLYGIALKNNTTVDKIKKDNNLTSNSLSIGQILYL